LINEDMYRAKLFAIASAFVQRCIAWL